MSPVSSQLQTLAMTEQEVVYNPCTSKFAIRYASKMQVVGETSSPSHRNRHSTANRVSHGDCETWRCVLLLQISAELETVHVFLHDGFELPHLKCDIQQGSWKCGLIRRREHRKLVFKLMVQVQVFEGAWLDK